MSEIRIAELTKLAKEVYGPTTEVRVVSYPRPSLHVCNAHGGDFVRVMTGEKARMRTAMRGLRSFLQTMREAQL